MAKAPDTAAIAVDQLSRQYPDDPCGYARWYLGRALWGKQEECARKLLEPPYRVLCRSGNAVGKTFVSACIASWWHDTFRPSTVLTTAPTAVQVRDLLFKELRTIRPLKDGLLPRATRLQRNHDHYIHGLTAATPDAFQGRHDAHLLLIFDEATGVRREFWDRAETMFHGQKGHGWLTIYNPNDISTPPYFFEQREGWHHVHISALEHPNVAAGIAGLPPLIPSAITYERVCSRIREECDRVTDREPQPPHDFEFPVGSGHWYEPQTPEFEAQILGRWPTSPVNNVWNDKLWDRINTQRYDIKPNYRAQIGCDVARFGNDETTMHVRIGPVSVHHESHKSWGTNQTAARLKQLCHEFRSVGGRDENPKRIPVVCDSSGVGGGVIDQCGDYMFIGINSATRARSIERFPNTRSELWFTTVDLARADLIDVSRIPAEPKHRIHMELMSPTYKLDTLSRRAVEPKDQTKSRLGHSPDNADAFNLAYYIL